VGVPPCLVIHVVAAANLKGAHNSWGLSIVRPVYVDVRRAACLSSEGGPIRGTGLGRGVPAVGPRGSIEPLLRVRALLSVAEAVCHRHASLSFLSDAQLLA
jgi:hypothetical protein